MRVGLCYPIMRLIFWRTWRKLGANLLFCLTKIKQFQGVKAFFSTCRPCSQLQLLFDNSVAKFAHIYSLIQKLINAGSTLLHESWPHKQPQTCVEYAETTDLKSAGNRMERNKKGQKLTKKIIKSFKFRLVRMRSAVQIRPAAPENSLFLRE